MNPGILYAFLYLIWTHQLYPGVSMPIAAFVGVALMFFPALLYIWMSIAMPRSGGEYIWGSRTLSPQWGLVAGWGLTLVGLAWAGGCIYWATSWGFNMALRALAVSAVGSSFASHPLWGVADLIDTPLGSFVVGTVLLISFMLIMWRGARAAMMLAWIGVISGTIGMLAFDIGVFTGGGLPSFIAGFNAMSGTTYQAVLSAAKSAGWQVGVYSIPVSLTGGITYVALNTLGFTYTANIMGEIKQVRKSAIIAMLGAPILQMIYWVSFYAIAYYGFGGDFWAAASYFATGGAGYGTWSGWPFGAVMPMPNFLLVFLNPNVAYSVVASLGFFFTTYASCMGMAFGPIRNIFAYSFDRVLPTCFAKTDKRGSPWVALILGTLLAEFFLVWTIYAPVAYSVSSCTILAWFFAWAIVGVIGMAFPYTKRGKAILEKSPEIVKKKVAGLPIVFIWGLTTFIVSVAIDYYMLLPYFQGLATSTYIWVTIIMFIVPPFIFYPASLAYHKRKHVAMELQFKEIPPD
jgi:amino acid transporter